MINIIQTKYIKVITQENTVQRNKNVKIRLIKDYLSFLSKNDTNIEQSTIRDINHYLATALNHLCPGTYNHRVLIFRHFYEWLYHHNVIPIEWGSHLLRKKEPQLLVALIDIKTETDMQAVLNKLDSIESKFDAKFDAIESKFDALDSKIDNIRWFILGSIAIAGLSHQY
ncbi:MAG: hypothetical protein ACWIPH_08995 [Ostreibacterium sp.]